jgi:hypothetical protein
VQASFVGHQAGGDDGARRSVLPMIKARDQDGNGQGGGDGGDQGEISWRSRGIG